MAECGNDDVCSERNFEHVSQSVGFEKELHEEQKEKLIRQGSELDIHQPPAQIFSDDSIVSVLDFPNRISTYFDDDDGSLKYRELQAPLEEHNHEDLVKTWEMNYNEASIYLEEGENNDKFDYHPQSNDSLPAYFLVHNPWFYRLDLLAAVMLLGLALVEEPAVPGFQIDLWIHASLELVSLFIIGIELVMKLYWMGVKPFFQHRRSIIKLAAILMMFIESMIVIIRQASHFRISRGFRPVYLIDNYYCGGIRRVTRQILQSLPPILEMLGLLLFFMLIFSVLGFYLFSSNPKNPISVT
ncbi:two pore calcium channel protein 1-like, partial [Limulus polyphemus]|uniref:Two pore calcium channel protein 1-like n=1 Tax=Limulus polyphemus TaxID=6850 RepID=A0ABM1TBX9_LIMPO